MDPLNQLTAILIKNKLCKKFSKTQTHSARKVLRNLLDAALGRVKPFK